MRGPNCGLVFQVELKSGVLTSLNRRAFITGVTIPRGVRVLYVRGCIGIRGLKFEMSFSHKEGIRTPFYPH